MSKTNWVLLAVLVALAAVYFLGGSHETPVSHEASRLFPDFNKEAADKIVFKDGWSKTSYEYDRTGSSWLLASAGGFPAKQKTVDTFLDAVYQLRAQNYVGDSADLRKETRTDGEGRLVEVYRGDKAMARFRVGKNPKRNPEEFFVRKEDGKKIYRTRTILTKDRLAAPDTKTKQPWDMGARGFSWDNYINDSKEWLHTKIWDLSDAVPQTLLLTRKGQKPIRLVRKGPDEWDMTAPTEAKADTDAADGIATAMKSLYLVDVVGKYKNVKEKYGLDNPSITLDMTLQKEVEVKDEGDHKSGTGDKKDDKKKAPTKKKVTLKRIVYVGSPVKRATYFDQEKGAPETQEYYPVAIAGDFTDPEQKDKAAYVYLVRDYSISSLRKTVDDLKQKSESKEGEGAAKKNGTAEKTPATPPKKGEEKAPEKKAAPEKPAGKQPADSSGEPKKEQDAAGSSAAGAKKNAPAAPAGATTPKKEKDTAGSGATAK